MRLGDAPQALRDLKLAGYTVQHEEHCSLTEPLDKVLCSRRAVEVVDHAGHHHPMKLAGVLKLSALAHPEQLDDRDQTLRDLLTEFPRFGIHVTVAGSRDPEPAVTQALLADGHDAVLRMDSQHLRHHSCHGPILAPHVGLMDHETHQHWNQNTLVDLAPELRSLAERYTTTA